MEACRLAVSADGGNVCVSVESAGLRRHAGTGRGRRLAQTVPGQALETLCSAGMAKPAFFAVMRHFKGSVENAMWYVIQTITGKEEELRLRLAALLDRERFRDCFIIRAEWLKRLGGEWKVQVRPLFPGYVFVETAQPQELYLKLKTIPKFSRLLGNGSFEFTALEPDDEDFLKRICHVGEDRERRWLVRLSTVETVSGAIRCIEGPLKAFEKQIERMNLHKRYAVVRIKMCHREQTVLFGLAGNKRAV